MSAIGLAAALARAHEGCRLSAYRDPGKGIWTIGFGHTGPEVQRGLIWTQTHADQALEGDMATALDQVARLKQRVLSDQQMAALGDFVFNLGAGNLEHSELLSLVNAGRWMDTARQFLRFDHIGIIQSRGLLLRRLEEAALFLKGSA